MRKVMLVVSFIIILGGVSWGKAIIWNTIYESKLTRLDEYIFEISKETFVMIFAELVTSITQDSLVIEIYYKNRRIGKKFLEPKSSIFFYPLEPREGKYKIKISRWGFKSSFLEYRLIVFASNKFLEPHKVISLCWSAVNEIWIFIEINKLGRGGGIIYSGKEELCFLFDVPWYYIKIRRLPTKLKLTIRSFNKPTSFFIVDYRLIQETLNIIAFSRIWIFWRDTKGRVYTLPFYFN